MINRKNTRKRGYHHGTLAQSLLDAVDQIAGQFGLDAVTLRGCAKLVGVSPSAAFRHYADKRALMTAFAARALAELSAQIAAASTRAKLEETNPFMAVGLAYVAFAVDKPASFRAMWHHETIYANDPGYLAATEKMRARLRSGFVNTIRDNDDTDFSSHELLAWSSVHGLANLFVDGLVAVDKSRGEKMAMAAAMLKMMTFPAAE